MKYFSVVGALLLVMFIVSCSGNKKANLPPGAKGPGLVSNGAVSAPMSEGETNILKGKVVYKQNCVACHQTDGNGVPSIYPPLKGTEWVLGDKESLVKLVLEGLNGSVKVNGTEYNGIMSSFSYLSDEEIAHVLTYIRANFGNTAPEITKEDVEKVRGAMK